MSELIYLDNSATTRPCREALEKYCEVASGNFANPSSLHTLGYNAEGELKRAREIILSSMSAKDSELIFCASGSEANNLAIFGRALSKERYKRGSRIITTMGEHSSVSEPFARLAEMGFEVVCIPTRNGELDMGALTEALTKNVILVSIMLVNNETGAVYDIKSVSGLMRAYAPEAVLHVDATQGYLKIPFTKTGLGADMITVSSHKIEGPKGVGALLIDKKIIKNKGISPLIYGGGQEGGLRSGTENVPAIAAFGAAVERGVKGFAAETAKMRALRDYLIEKLDTDPTFSEIYVTRPRMCAPHILNVTLPNIKSETMLHFLSSRGIFVSSGSACSSNSRSTSGALVAYGHSEKMADSSIRISFSHTNETSDVDRLCEAMAEGLATLARTEKKR